MARKPKTLAEIRAAHRAAERDHVLAALKRSDWALAATARALDIGRSSLQSLLRSHGLAEEYAKHSHKPGPRPATPEQRRARERARLQAKLKELEE